MNVDHILVRYSEIALKGKNRATFERTLKGNINRALAPFPQARAKRTTGRLIVDIHNEDAEAIMKKLRHIFGIVSLSYALKTSHELIDIQATALEVMNQNQSAKTFKVNARRSYKSFPIRSQQLNHDVGGYVLKNSEGITVDVHNPDVELLVEVREQGTYISAGKISGPGGLPVGSSGKVMLMLSGGIDSPVSGYLALKRGTQIEAIHFHSPPFTNERAKQKVIDLSRVLADYGGSVRLHVIPFTDLQQYIHEEVAMNYEMTIMRRVMMRISEQVAREQEALAIVNGESLGQVSSQTLESMHTIEEVANTPVLRPLITMDKVEVTDIAKQIGTYETSILPYEDCCTIFLPAESKTKPKREKARFYESFLDMDEKINTAVSNRETFVIDAENRSNEAFAELL
ncbi:tRNA uracil 4-sulfurtransferase ThiI [Natribacillus halophilus]|uniref:Probable tRNA sulfurtransferase n=1 Tax=Natribacillus halophilus TaxID=549003 RepID=A0A1G8NEH7_9BACI|nr:tRNA uracil 4-sulfurtransferase ThiI [Natribacillus halophilus]SDI78467.1 thiamine biosynthesis protein ThiI [Natribacillus halophilus]